MSEKNNCCASDDCCGEQSIIEKVKDYYGKQLQSKDDLKTSLARFRYLGQRERQVSNYFA